MKKKIALFAVLTLIFVAGCQKKEEKSAVSPQGSLMQPATPQAAFPGPGASAANPHAGLQVKEFTEGGAGHKGKVLQKIDAAGYTYIEMEEKGKKLWIAVMQSAINKGDVVEIPESPVMVKFTSKTLNRTFDEILFAGSIRVVKE